MTTPAERPRPPEEEDRRRARLEDDVLDAAAYLLSEAVGARAHLGEATVLAARRSIVARVAVESDAAGAPATVVIKQARRGGDSAYDPADAEPESRAALLFNDWASCHFLNGTPGLETVAPRLLAGDRERGFIVLEDLGDGDCLVDLLLGADPARARAGLLAYAAALGRVNARTAGAVDRYRALRATLGPSTGAALPPLSTLRPAFEAVVASAEALGAEVPVEAAGECDSVAVMLAGPGPFLAFSPTDSCPDNNRVGEGTFRLFDFEGGGFRHALLDGAYCRLALPTCWCVGRLPELLPLEMEAAYRAELVAGCPPAADDATFRSAMLRACAAWLIWTTSWLLPRVTEHDRPMGPVSTYRQGILLRLDTFAVMAAEAGELPALRRFSERLAAALRRHWPEAATMPLYPAFA
jgi:hypothetical protein